MEANEYDENAGLDESMGETQNEEAGSIDDDESNHAQESAAADGVYSDDDAGNDGANGEVEYTNHSENSNDVDENEGSTHEDADDEELLSRRAAIAAELARMGEDEDEQSMDGPRFPLDGLQSPMDDPQSPMDDPQSPMDGSRSPLNGPQSPLDDPQSPIDDPQSPMIGPQSPMDGSGSPIDDQQSSGSVSQDYSNSARSPNFENNSRNSHENNSNNEVGNVYQSADNARMSPDDTPQSPAGYSESPARRVIASPDSRSHENNADSYVGGDSPRYNRDSLISPNGDDNPTSPGYNADSPGGDNGPASPEFDAPQSPDGGDAIESSGFPKSPEPHTNEQCDTTSTSANIQHDIPYSPSNAENEEAPQSPDALEGNVDPRSPEDDALQSSDAVGEIEAPKRSENWSENDGPLSPADFGNDAPKSPEVLGLSDAPQSPDTVSEEHRNVVIGPASPLPPGPGSPTTLGDEQDKDKQDSGEIGLVGSPLRTQDQEDTERLGDSHDGSSVRGRHASPMGSGKGSPLGSRAGSPLGSGAGSPPGSRAGSPMSRGGSPMGSRDGSPVGRPRSTVEKDGDVSDADSDIIGVKRKRPVKDSDDEDESDKGSAVGELIADIFGPSDEEEEFEGFGADLESQKKKDQKSTDEGGDRASGSADKKSGEESSDEELDRGGKRFEDGVSDFERMLMKKKEENQKRRRKRKDVDIINDNDDLIDELVKKMKEAAEEDRQSNQDRKPAVKKLKMLPEAMLQLKKADLHMAFLDGGILNAMTEWLAPLPDKSLPHLQIREAMLKQLTQFPSISTEGLKISGIGKAVMYLAKHPKEIRTNKETAMKLINEWSRPIFNLTSNYKNLSREEREQRDYEQLPKKRRISLEGGSSNQDIDRALAGNEKVLRPGDPGYVYRARVPLPSTKDYVIRPKWAVEEKAKSAAKKSLSRYEKCSRSFADKKRKSSYQASKISIEGRNMSL